MMKIAVITDDEQSIGQHFGRAPYYVVTTIENGQIIKRERRDKLGHAHFANEPHAAESHEADPRGHGFDPAAQDRHVRMAVMIADCAVLLCRGMGAGAYESLKQVGIRPIVTDIADIDEAVQAYLEGKIIDRIDRLH
jgi:predicted Fe-Mo cluster-binding NifX family protein